MESNRLLWDLLPRGSIAAVVVRGAVGRYGREELVAVLEVLADGEVEHERIAVDAHVQ